MANIIPLKDNTGAQFYPQTHEKAVVDSNGVNLQTKLASITTPTYVTAWDGDSTPVVANIPAGVSVTYNTTTYTGTLAASASTANKTYLVSTGTTDNYNRYVTQLNGSTYSWQNLGSTEIDLSDYVTQEEFSQLDQEINGSFAPVLDHTILGSSLTSCGGTIRGSDNKWFQNPTYYGAIISIEGYHSVTIHRNTNLSTDHFSYAFITAGPSWGNSAQYATGYNAVVDSESDVTVEVPSDAVYLYVYLNSNGTIYTPESIDLLTLERVGGLQKSIEKIEDDLYVGEDRSITILGASLSTCGGTIRTSDNTWQTNNQYYGAIVLITEYVGRPVIIRKAATSEKVSYAFVKSGPSWGNSVQYATGYSAVVDSEQDVETTIPSDAVYLYVYLASESVSFRPDSIVISLPPTPGIKAQVEKNTAELTPVCATVSSFSSCGGTINTSTNKWQADANYYGGLVEMSEYRGKNVRIEKNINGNTLTYTFLTDRPSWGNTPSYASGYSSIITSKFDVTIQVPEDAVYLYVYLRSGSTIYEPEKVTVLNMGIGYDFQILQKETVQSLRVLSPGKIKIATYNIGHFSGGASPNSTITSSNYIAKLAAYRQVIDTIDADVLGISEYSKIFGKNTSNVDVNTRDVLLKDYIPYEGTQMNYSCDALFRKTIVENIAPRIFDCNQTASITHTTAIKATDYYYVEADLYMRGHLVKLVVTHLAFDNNNPQVCADQISELITKFASYDKVVMIGDWNVATFNQFDTFVSAGYTMANDGTYYTYPSESRALDNIIVKGLTISEPGMIETSGLSDHYPFYCTLEV